MKEFWIRVMCVLILAGILAEYNRTVEARQKDEKIQELTAELEGVRTAADAQAGEPAGRDGIYTGEAQGYGGTIKVEAKISGGRLTDIKVVEADGEDGAYLSMAEEILPAILEAQGAQVDTVSGATFSSSAIREAAAQALEKAVQGQ